MPRRDVDITWKGGQIEKRVRRAIGRATIGVGSNVTSVAKEKVDVITGDLMRSIHIAVVDTDGLVAANAQNTRSQDGALLEVGSWLDYACVEEVGRMHQFMHPAIYLVGQTAYLTYKAAFEQEGFFK